MAESTIVDAVPVAVGAGMPKRVKDLFVHCDTNKDGRISLEEAQAGIGNDVGTLAAHASEAIPALFKTGCEKLNTDTLDEKWFMKLYCSVLYKHFDADNNGKLERAEAEKALAFLANGKPIALSLPPEIAGDVGVSMPAFWEMFKLMND
eukprot:CAMPEP_0174719384 /NCGR_PEP_ID=MMETSP1094-20130205/30947_1 /TAXON_ID=156173 /ORGANISM="Chrysochromulina brevifilum, Strain UTEX LB 985" /LENGTH=148 /DNA_ID=CAMNT_0015919669 /DNA_START=82 /DNA_END=528 /DNA_ORIENTATION=+